MSYTDPGFAFWLGWAEHGGALVEEMTGGTAVVVLPDRVQGALGLPEELAVTADPDAAREEGALLLVPGQPVLDRAAEAVLAEGDSGAAWVPWPATAAPTTANLVEAARDQFPVDHGRIDPAGEPAAVYAPLLRVGVLVTYAMSLDIRFQEREEILVDARTGLEVPEQARPRLGLATAGARPRDVRPELPSDVIVGLAKAHGLAGNRAVDRLSTLSSHADDDRRRLSDAAEAYYRDALGSVARRRATATHERQAMLDAQRDAIDLERVRRLAEIEATFTARHQLQPFRAHVVFVPALQVPVDVRRGSRVYPFTLTWLLGAAAFAGIRCPHCDATDFLVAGRHHLGCRTCLPMASLAAPTAPPLPLAPAPTQGKPAASGAHISARPSGPVRAAHPSETIRPARPSPRVTASKTAAASPASASVVGRRLADDFWAAVRFGERWPRKGKGVAAESPLAAALALYGPAGPARAVGLAHPRSLVDISARTLTGPQGHMITSGTLWAAQDALRFSLRWSFDGAKPVVSEVAPFFGARGARLAMPSELGADIADRVSVDVPPPRRALDPTAAEVWELAIGPLGLSVVLRCLAAWWRVAAEVAVPDLGPTISAAALVRLVGVRAGVPKTLLPVPAVDDTAVADAARRLNRHLRLTRDRAW